MRAVHARDVWLGSCLLLACGGQEGGATGVAGAAAGAGAPPLAGSGARYGLDPERDYRAEAAWLPDAVRVHLTTLADTIGPQLCAFSRSCCGHLGLAPWLDCTRMADQVVWFQSPGPSVTPDPEWTERCLALLEQPRGPCAGPESALDWFFACSNTVRGEGQYVGHCNSDADCELLRGPGHGCVQGVCKPTQEIPVGGSCDVLPAEPTKPVCGADARCVGVTCTALLGEGAPCTRDECLPGLYCTFDGVCVPGKGLGESCGPELCAEGLKCRPVFPASDVCVVDAAAGEACTENAECRTGSCIGGVCVSTLVDDAFCVPPGADDLPGDTRLVDLREYELAALCAWGEGIFEDALQCMGVPQGSGAGCAPPSQETCQAHVAELRACLPRFAAALDGCRLAEPGYPLEARRILAGLQECAALSGCMGVLGRGW